MPGDGHIGFTDADVAELAEIVREVENAQAAMAAAQVAQTRALARAHDLAQRQAAGKTAHVRARDMALRAIAAELAGVLRTSDRAVQRRIGDAVELVDDYPAVLDAWEGGLLTPSHARLITELGAPLPPEARTAFEAVAIAVCQEDTPGRVRSRLRIMADRLHPRTFAERHRDARENRSVRLVDIGEGMSELIATLPTLLAAAVYDRLTAQGRAITDAAAQARDDLRARADSGSDAGDGFSRAIPTEVTASDHRTMDQIRADVLADMLLTAQPGADPTRTDDGAGTLGAIRARVQVVVPALTLLGAEDGPVDLPGRAPIDPRTARTLVGATPHPLERILTDPVTGSVVEVDTYRRPASLDRYLRARDRRCRFPGCLLPAVRCEVDHLHDHARGGRTCRGNLAHECQRHHSMKQFTAWKVRPLAGGVLEWTSPLGRVYTDDPPPPATFLPDDLPGPDDDAPF